MRGGQARGVAVVLVAAALSLLGTGTLSSRTVRPADDDRGPTIDCLFDGGLMDCAGLNPKPPR